jgi:hypothetical protein
MDEQRRETEELKAEQGERETSERELAEQEPSDEATAVHERRAEKHAYLKEKLAERAESEREAE